MKSSLIGTATDVRGLELIKTALFGIWNPFHNLKTVRNIKFLLKFDVSEF